MTVKAALNNEWLIVSDYFLDVINTIANMIHFKLKTGAFRNLFPVSIVLLFLLQQTVCFATAVHLSILDKPISEKSLTFSNKKGHISSETATRISPKHGSNEIPATILPLPIGSAMSGNRTLNISGFTAGCDGFEILQDPSSYLVTECGTIGLDWNLPANKSTITATVTVSNAPSPSNPNNMLDSNAGTSHLYKSNTMVNLEVVRFTFPQAAKLNAIELQTTSVVFQNNSNMKVQGSTDGSTWTDLTSTLNYPSDLVLTTSLYGGTTTVYRYAFPSNNTAYSYYRIFGSSGGTNFGQGISEAFFGIVFEEQANISNISCNNGGTPFNASDDFITFQLNPTGGTGNYTVSVAGTTVTPTTAAFGVPTTFTLPVGSAGSGNKSLTITGFTAGCEVIQTVTDPGPCVVNCSFVDYNITANKANIILSTTASVSGSINVLKDGNDLNNNFFYSGTTQAVANKEYVRMQFPSPTVLKGFELVVGAFLFANGTVMRVDGSNDGTNWTALHTETETATSPACLYTNCTNAESYAFPSNNSPYIYYRLFGVSGSSRSTPWINELYFDIVPNEQINISNIACNPNGTIFSATDDFITFQLNPTGGTGTYNVSVAGTTVTPSVGTFGSPTTFTLPAGTAGTGNRSITVSGFTASCAVVETLTDPGSCTAGPCGSTSINWNLPANKSTITASVTVSNSPSPSDPNLMLDSNAGTSHFYKNNTMANLEVVRFTFPQAVKLFGIELATTQVVFQNNSNMKVQGSTNGTTWTDLTAGLIYPTNLALVASQYGASTTVYRYEFANNNTDYQYYRIFGSAGGTNFGQGFNEAFFAFELANPGLTNFGLNTNGTPSLHNDDKVVFNLNPIPGTGSYQVSVNGGFTISPTTATYGQSTPFELSLGSASASNLVVRIIDTTVPCFQDIPLPSTNVDVTVVQAACTGPTSNPLSSILMTGANGTFERAGFSIGATYTGPDFSTATVLSNLSSGFTIASNIANPSTPTYYTVRAYFSATSFKDYVVVVNKKVCSTADLSLSISPTTLSANKSENMVYTVTLNNAGPDPAVNVSVKVDIPVGLDLLNFGSSVGSYSQQTQLWTISTVPLGAQTLTLTYKMK